MLQDHVEPHAPMPELAKRSKPTSRDELESRQLTLDDWASVQEADRERRNDDQRVEAGDGGLRFRARRSAEPLESALSLLTCSHNRRLCSARSALRDLGLERRAVDAVFRALPVVALPGYSRPLVRVEDYRELVERNTFRDDRVRPGKRAA